MAGKRPPETNAVRIEGGLVYIDVGTAAIPGAITVIDADDAPRALDGKGRWYAVRSHRAIYARRNRPGTTEFLHRLLCSGIPDHVNGNGLDNRRENLRPATNAQNSRNRASHRGSSSRYKGVSFDRGRGKWLAQLWVDGKPKYKAAFALEEDAARAYDAAAREHHGAFARVNFPEEQPA